MNQQEVSLPIKDKRCSPNKSFVVIINCRVGKSDKIVEMSKKAMFHFKCVKVHNHWVCQLFCIVYGLSVLLTESQYMELLVFGSIL